MAVLSGVRPQRTVSPFTAATITVGDESATVRCLEIRSIAAVLDPDAVEPPAEGNDLARAWMALADEPGMEIDAEAGPDVVAAIAESYLAMPPRLRRRARGRATRALVYGGARPE